MGPATKDKLDALGITSVAHVRARSKAALQRELGGKTGASVRARKLSMYSIYLCRVVLRLKPQRALAARPARRCAPLTTIIYLICTCPCCSLLK